MSEREKLIAMTGGEEKRSKLLISVCLLMFILIVLFLGTAPVHAKAMETTDNCGSVTGQDKTPVPLCCLTSDCPLADASAINSLPCPERLAFKKSILPVRFPIDLASKASFNLKLYTPQKSFPQNLHPPDDIFCCRNSLESEEPPLK